MLVLSRKRNERLLIGENIKITVLRIGPNAVQFGIDAPREMPIVREGLVDHVSPQHEGPLEPDGGPASPPLLAAMERVAPDLRILGITPKVES